MNQKSYNRRFYNRRLLEFSSNSIDRLLEITIYWINQDWKFKEILIDFYKLSGPHPGEDLCLAKKYPSLILNGIIG